MNCDDDGIIAYMDNEEPLRCPMCGCGDPEQVTVRYHEFQDYTGETQTRDEFKCDACGSRGEYE